MMQDNRGKKQLVTELSLPWMNKGTMIQSWVSIIHPGLEQWKKAIETCRVVELFRGNVATLDKLSTCV